jgi:hypothetical protein
MRPIAFAAFVSFTTTALFAAPAPPPRPETLSKAQQSLHDEAEAAVKDADRIMRNLSLEVSMTRAEVEVRNLQLKELYRKAGDKYSGLAASLTGGARRSKDVFSLKAATAWRDAGEYAKALAIYTEVAQRSVDPHRRVESLGMAIACHQSLGQPGATRRILAAVRKEIPGLEGDYRRQWERWLDEAEKVP